MSSTDVIGRLPSCWHGLFAALRCPRDGLRLAEVWLQHRTSSQLHTAPQWQTLLACLTESEPQCHGSSLVFMPLFCSLPPDLQIKLLSVIYQHRWRICSSSLHTFVRAVHEHTKEGTWQRTLCDMLKRFLLESPEPRKEMDLTLIHFNFTQDNAALADKVCGQLLSSYSVPPWQTNSEVGTTGTTLKQKNNIPPPADTLSSEHCLEEEHDPVTVGLPVEELALRDMIVLDDEASSQDSPPAKRARQQDSTPDDTANDKSDVPVDKTLQEKAVWVREVLQSSSLPDLDVTELNFMSGLPACQMKLLCDAVDVSSLPDGYLVMAFELLRQINPAVSYSSCVAFISGCFIPKFCGLDHLASRELTGVLMNLAKSFPKQLIDSVTTNSHIVSHMTSSQSDVLCRLCKESFNTECQVHLLRTLLLVCEVVSEHAVPVVACVLENLDSLDEITLAAVVDGIHQSACSLAHSLKFGKLVFSFVSKHAKLLSASQLSVLFQVSELHKTFMKKSMLAALKRISK